MNPHPKEVRKPEIILAKSDYDRLSGFAELHEQDAGDVVNELFTELDRAQIVPDQQVPAKTIRMGSAFTFHTDDGRDRDGTLVFPADADIAAGRISILTPIGAALIGLTEGQSITWTARDGHRHVLTVTHVDA